MRAEAAVPGMICEAQDLCHCLPYVSVEHRNLQSYFVVIHLDSLESHGIPCNSHESQRILKNSGNFVQHQDVQVDDSIDFLVGRLREIQPAFVRAVEVEEAMEG